MQDQDTRSRRVVQLRPDRRSSTPRRFPNGKKLKDAADFDVFILDGAPQASKQTKEMAGTADLLIIPTGDSFEDREPAVELANDLYSGAITGVSGRVDGGTFCRRSRSTSITFPGEPLAITRAAGRVQGPRYRAARSQSRRMTSMRSRRCVSCISDRSALARAFSARNASSLCQFVNFGMRSTTFQRHFLRVLARDLKPGAHFGRTRCDFR